LEEIVMAEKLRELTLAECEKVSGGWNTAAGVLTATTKGSASLGLAAGKVNVYDLTVANGVGIGTFTTG
jgi:hypothetical protein